MATEPAQRQLFMILSGCMRDAFKRSKSECIVCSAFRPKYGTAFQIARRFGVPCVCLWNGMHRQRQRTFWFVFGAHNLHARAHVSGTVRSRVLFVCM